jgi:hypothetical protein
MNRLKGKNPLLFYVFVGAFSAIVANLVWRMGNAYVW